MTSDSLENLNKLKESAVPDEDSDDPIVSEIPIIHSNQLEDVLHLFQYPLRKINCANEHNVKKCFYKPKNQEVKLEVAISTDSPNFDTGRAEVMAKEVEAGLEKDNKQTFFENDIVDKVFLQSTLTTKECNKYAVVAFNGQEIHLTPVKGIYQLRPVFPYMEKSLKRKKGLDKGHDSDDEEAGPSTVQKVTVKFKNDDEKWKKINETSYKFLQARSAEEPWIECDWCDENDTKSEVERLKLFSENVNSMGQAKDLSSEEYIKLLVPEDKEQKPLEPALPSHILSLHALRALPIQEQCRLLLKDAQVIQFQQLLMVLAGGEGVSQEALLKVLPKVAVLVRGNWVVRSEVLYPPNTFSAISGVPAELMVRARDYILYQFTQNKFVERKKISSTLSIPSEEIKEIFTGISKLRHHEKGWELHLPADHDFIYKHSELVQKQNLNWEHRYHHLCEFFKDNRKQRRKSRSESKSISEDGKVRNGFSFSSDNESGNEKNKSPVAGRKNKSIKMNGAAPATSASVT